MHLFCFKGFAYTHKKNQQEIYKYENWQENYGRTKAATTLSYDSEYKNVLSWGFPVLAERPSRRSRASNKSNKRTVELFKLYLLNSPNKPPLPNGLDYRKAITDYLRELGKVIRQTIISHWNINFDTQVLIVLLVNKINF
jgi:hypothetical protein